MHANDLIFTMQSVDLCNSEGNSALHWACINGHEEAVRLLMEKNAEPSKLNSFDRTPVDEALDRQFQGVVDIIKSFSTPAENDEVDDVEDDQGRD
jgi:ankyrin repeat protein